MNQEQLDELLLQALEHERGGIRIYETALKCAVNQDLREEWEKYLDETRNHEKILTGICSEFKLDPEQETVVYNNGEGLKNLDAVAGLVGPTHRIKPSLRGAR